VKLVGHRRVFSVEEVTARLAEMFEGLRQFWVEAEIEDVRTGGARVYFNLRGEHVIRASMKAAVWDRLPQKPARGDQVLQGAAPAGHDDQVHAVHDVQLDDRA
jgi:hypothetical protein